VVPLTFLDTALATGSRLVVLSQPLRRYTEAKSMRGELLTLGADLFELLDGLEETVVVVSCDLAHTHLASGPYGYSPAAEPFDKSVGEWAATLDPFPLLEVAASLEAGALSCGFTGLVLLHGILAKAAQTVQKSESSGDSELKWTATMYVDAAPTYYGMMVASFFPPE
jgi:aromatic ring-opening dioxygenase LigB subunit